LRERERERGREKERMKEREKKIVKEIESGSDFAGMAALMTTAKDENQTNF
jgi:hypothetical protein